MEWLEGPPAVLRREAHFGDRVIACFAERPTSVHGMIAEALARNPDGEAVVCGDERLTYRSLVERGEAVARALAARGIASGDRVAVLVGNRIEFVVILVACGRIGAIMVPMGIRLQTPEIAHILGDCGAKLLFHEAELASRLPPLDGVTAVAVGDGHSFADFVAGGAGHPDVRAAAIAEEDTAFILYTSGTTGRPKGAMIAHLNVVHSAMVYEHCMRLTAADRSIAPVPLSHVTGLIANIAAMIRVAGTLVIMPAFKASEFLALVARERITMTVAVPAMYNLCLLEPDFDAHDLSSLRIGGYGGAPMPPPTIEKLAAKLPGLMLVNAYGATETTSPTTVMPPRFTASHGDSVGVPAPGCDVMVVDDAGREVAPGETGEIWIRSGSVVKGYWANPAATTESFTGGYWHSGDIGSIDAEGFVRVFDRKKDMINRGGYKVFTAEVETVLAGVDGVIECAVIARPCPVLGERVHAIVVTREEGGPTAADLKARCLSALSDYKVPETVTVQTEPLPRNANGKVIKRQLREGLEALSR
ncbi:class I adenylate-forming enzyme family protein [Phreatobacter aquaticus]|nr:AMP-binding protein [Phreatobacter aquaticus]